jgi:hypothetical protein
MIPVVTAAAANISIFRREGVVFVLMIVSSEITVAGKR